MSVGDAMPCSSEGHSYLSSHPSHSISSSAQLQGSHLSQTAVSLVTTMPCSTYQEVTTLHNNTNAFSTATCNNGHGSAFGIVPPITQPVKLEEMQKQTGQDILKKH